MISRNELRQIARERLKDAEALLNADRYDGAVYLGGHVVELALKSRICKVLIWQGFPQTSGEFQNFQSFKTHDLDVLLSLSGFEDKIRTNYLPEWSAIGIWDSEIRYNPVGNVTKADAQLLVASARKLLSVL